MYDHMTLKHAMDWLKPTTLLAIIADCTDDNGLSDPKGRAIIYAALATLDANMGLDEARPMIEAEGIDFDDLCRLCLPEEYRRHIAKRQEARTDQIAVASDLLATLKDVDLRCAQAEIASRIGKKSGQKQADFLRGELDRMAIVVRAAIDTATGTKAL